MIKLIKKKYPLIINFIQYGVVGVVGTVFHTAVLAFCVEYFQLIPVISTIIGFLVSLVVSYRLNLVWTFKKSNFKKRRFIKYAITCSFGLILNVAIMFLITDILELSYWVGQLIAVILVPVFNFSISKKWVFVESEKGTQGNN